MPLTASVEQFLARRAGAGAVRIDQLPLHQARDYFARFAPLADVAARPVHTVEDVTFDARDGTALAARVYYPRTPDWTNPLPALLYFHSGGYVVGTLETADAVCRMLAAASGCAVVSVDYRLAPEHRFPCAVYDAFDALHWLHRDAGAFALDAGRLAVGGESSGATLAAVTAVHARDAGIALALQLLIYPALSALTDSVTHRLYGEGYFLTLDVIRWIHRTYLRDVNDRHDWRFAPLDGSRHAPASLASLAPAWIVSAQYDPLRHEHAAYTARLREAGNRAEARFYRGMIHGFFSMGRVIPEASIAHRDTVLALRAALGLMDGASDTARDF
ncbi:alpha/beta hydrolase [Paraburkholderia strydomiana]|jgi:acetyl esterase|uniref:alpha/beta hydrolase n=1 Tax=Paraburkholderia strydomiana TaxID=1245417 RepID=UPI0038BA5199